MDEANKTEQLRHQKAKKALTLKLLQKGAAEARQRGDIAAAEQIERRIAQIERGT